MIRWHLPPDDPDHDWPPPPSLAVAYAAMLLALLIIPLGLLADDLVPAAFSIGETAGRWLAGQ